MSASLAPIQPETATGTAKQLLDRVKQSKGKVPNMTKVMANSPTLLKSWLALSAAVNAGTLSTAVRDQLAIATAQRNGCEYCLSAHTYLGEHVAKLPASELAAARKGESDDPHVQALLQFSNEIHATSGDVSAEAVAAARAAGVTDEEIGELVAYLALNTLTNYFNVLAGVPNDWPVVSL
jgi:uncharacterized peroxidase-related enzyme